MKRYLPRLMLLALLLLSSSESTIAAPLAAPPPPTPEEPVVELAVKQAIERQAEDVMALLVYTTEISNTRVSSDAQWATSQLVPLDPDTGAIIPSEPGLAIAFQSNGSWTAVTQNDSAWIDLLNALPDDLMPAEEKENWLGMYALETETALSAPLGGYHLPWARNTGLILTRSITHHDPVNVNGSMHYSFDFATPWDSSGQSQMFQVHAAKAGRVKHVRWVQPTNSEASPGNYIVLEDTTTTPTTYQLYLHLDYESIPTALRTIGAPVQQGQFLGIADDTGASTGHHLHFQVHTNPNSYWGSSVDITFLEVTINGGRPRTPSEAKYYPQYGNQGQSKYISQNILNGDSTPPIGEILWPPGDGELVQSSILPLEAFAIDGNSGLYTARFIANWDGTWQEIGPVFTASNLLYEWDLCTAGVPDGPVSVALALEDLSGNKSSSLPGLRHLIKQYACEPPPPAACTPASGQVALYSGAGYTGDCQVFNADSSILASELGSVGSDRAVSIRVGSGMQATLYAGDNLQGRGETFTADDPNLSDNRAGAASVSSLKVQAASAAALPPRPVYPPAGAVFGGSDAVNSWSLSWDDAGFGVEFQARLMLGSTVIRTSQWLPDAFWHLGGLEPGVYNWQVRARSLAQKAGSTQSNWSSAVQFTLPSAAAAAAPPPPPPLVEPVETSLPETNSSAPPLVEPVETSLPETSSSAPPLVGPVETSLPETNSSAPPLVEPVETSLPETSSSAPPLVEPVETSLPETSSYEAGSYEAGSSEAGSTFPLTFDMEGDLSGWQPSQNWDLTTLDKRSGAISWAYDANISADLSSYDTKKPNAGALTSPPIVLPAGGPVTLRFWYKTETEGPGRHWDQRWLQLSVDGGPFTNLLQLGDDPADYWLQSPPVDLSEYAGSTVRVRFYFATLDALDNIHKGWKIDDLTISADAPQACAAADPDLGSPAGAPPVGIGDAVDAAICTAGDIDYYAFDAAAGETLYLALSAQSTGSSLDPQMSVLAPDGASALAENDDLVLYQMPDSGIAFTAPQDGRYYVKIRAWDHPSSGGDEYFYRLRLVQDDLPPNVAFRLPLAEDSLSADADDQESGVRLVEFYWHSADWLSGAWQWLGYDANGSDGWSVPFDSAKAGSQAGAAFFVRARDWGGNTASAGLWDVVLGEPYQLYLPQIAR